MYIDIKSQSKFDGYSNFRDITNSPQSKLVAGSLNTFIHDGEKIEPRSGMSYLGVAGSMGVPVMTSVIVFFDTPIGTFQSAETVTGPTGSGTVSVANVSGNSNFNQLLITGTTGTFVIGDLITGGTSGATGVVTTILFSDQYWAFPHRIHSAYHNFINKEGIYVPLRMFYSGDITKGDVIEAWLEDPLNPGTKKWYQINLITPLNPIISTHRYYFAPWWDNINLQSRLCFSFGAKGYSPTFNTNWSASWTGGIAEVTALTATTITTDKEWVAKGFLVGPEGSQAIRANGVGYTVIGDYQTDTITVASTAGISVGDYVFQAINADQMPGDTTPNFTTADVIDAINNQVYYIDWKQRNVYISHNRNITASNGVLLSYNNLTGIFLLGEQVSGGASGASGTIYRDVGGILTFNVVSGTFQNGEIITGTTSGATADVVSTTVPSISNSLLTVFSGVGLDDANFSVSGAYSIDNNHQFKVIIDGTDTLNYQGVGGLDDISFSGSSTNTEVATYKVIIVSDVVVPYTLGVGVFQQGDIITGGTSGAIAQVSFNFVASLGNGTLLVEQISGTFIGGEIITASGSGATATTGDPTYQDGYQVYKDDILLSIAPWGTTNVLVLPIPIIPIGDGLSITFGNISGHHVGDFWTYEIHPNAGAQDTYAVYIDGVLQGTGHNPIVLTAIPIPVLVPDADGILVSTNSNMNITFFTLKGHTYSDLWQTFATAVVVRGYQNFEYTSPGRLPGEGFTLSLDSNGWTMKPQEHVMLINAQAGHYYNVELQLSDDLKSESVLLERLKSEPQNKTLFPYLIGYIKNQIASISQDKTYDVLGRQKFLELQQTKSISDEVRIDFETSDWEDADILYFKRKIYFNLPKMGLVFVYDDYKKYWHAPMQFGKRISLLAIIDDTLVGHSYEQNESYELFTGLNDLGIFPIKTRMVFPYDSFGKRMLEKSYSAIGFEGYILGNPDIQYTINSGIGGCEGQMIGLIKPFLCIPADRASLGKSSLGFHGLGNDPVQVIPHFFYIKTFDNQMFYHRNIELACDDLEQRWSIISLGTDVSMAGINNQSITDKN